MSDGSQKKKGPEQAKYAGEQAKAQAQGLPPALVELGELLKDALAKGVIPPLPFTFKAAGLTPEELVLMGKINDRLVGKIKNPDGKCIKPVNVAFPQSSDVLLSLAKTETDDFRKYFEDYFSFCDHNIIRDAEGLEEVVDKDLLNCTGMFFRQIKPTRCEWDDQPGTATKECPEYPYPQKWPPKWPPFWCLPPSCVTLGGKRHFYQKADPLPSGWIRRLFVADLVWLFYFERMGIFKILGAILDDFAYKGNYPISNGVIDSGIRDDVVAVVLETMVREMKQGLSSSVRDRLRAYRTCLGWTSDVGRKSGLETQVNTAFNNLFHKFVQNALGFYKDKRLAVAIQPTTPGKPSVATLVTVSDTIEVLKKAFDAFDYGRNYSNTLSGIVWVIAGMAIIRELRTTLRIPPAYEQPHEYIPAAYDTLVMKGSITPKEKNRYILHKQCANDARDILLDLEVINHQDTGPGGELETWLKVIEDKVEGYRTAYRSLTGVDLGEPGSPKVEQQV
jgi:hypothetical protein